MDADIETSGLQRALAALIKALQGEEGVRRGEQRPKVIGASGFVFYALWFNSLNLSKYCCAGLDLSNVR